MKQRRSPVSWQRIKTRKARLVGAARPTSVHFNCPAPTSKVVVCARVCRFRNAPCRKLNIAPCWCVYERAPTVENGTRTSENANKCRGLTAVAFAPDVWRYYVAIASKFTRVCSGLLGVGEVTRAGLGVALVGGRRVHFGVSGRGVSVF